MGNLPTHLHLALTRGGGASWANAHWQVRIILLRKDYFMNKDHKEALRITKKELCKKGNDSKIVAMELLFIIPNERDQSNKELTKVASNWFPVLSPSSNVCWFCSLYMVHIKHNGIIFQIYDKWLPIQFLQPNISSINFSDKT